MRACLAEVNPTRQFWHSRVMLRDRRREVELRPFPSNRRLVTAAVRAGRRMTPMHGLIEVDITDAHDLLADRKPPLSLTAYVVACVARAAAVHPEVHAYRNWRGQLVIHRHVDINTIVEIETPQGPFPLAHVIRDADIRDVDEISAELRTIKTNPSAGASGRWLTRAAPLAARLPGVIPAMYAVMGRSVRAKQYTGTVAVTAIGMFAGGGGFGIAQPSLMSLQVVVGGLSARPRVVDDEVYIRKVLDLTITVDHDVVDGAPAARFGAALRQLLEDATLVTSTH